VSGRALAGALLIAALLAGGSEIATAAPFGVTPAQAEPMDAAPASPDPTPEPGIRNTVIALSWDGPITALDWRGDGYAVAGDMFIGQSVAVPGDRIQRTATVANAGPAPAIATVQILDVSASDPSGSRNLDLEDCIHLFAKLGAQQYDASWRAAIEQADGDVSWQASVRVPQDGTFRLSVGAYFPARETRGDDWGDPSQVLSFAVQITMVQDVGQLAPPAPPGAVAVPVGRSMPELPESPHTPLGSKTGAPTGGSVAASVRTGGAGLACGIACAAASVLALWLRRRACAR